MTEPSPQVHVSLMHGNDWIRCCICFEVHVAPYERLAHDGNGQRWDVCAGQCAEDAGIR